MSEPQYDADSSRKCRACRHPLPHNRGEYEDTHSRCRHVARESCEVGEKCGHKRYSRKCEDTFTDGTGSVLAGCFSIQRRCDCSEEDRLIADLRAVIADLRATRTPATEGE